MAADATPRITYRDDVEFEGRKMADTFTTVKSGTHEVTEPVEYPQVEWDMISDAGQEFLQARLSHLTTEQIADRMEFGIRNRAQGEKQATIRNRLIAPSNKKIREQLTEMVLDHFRAGEIDAATELDARIKLADEKGTKDLWEELLKVETAAE